MGEDRARAAERCADADAGHRIFRGRHVEDTSVAEFLVQIERRVEDALGVGRAEAIDEDGGVIGERHGERVADGVSIGHHRHASASDVRSVQASDGSGKGEASAKSKAAATSAVTSV